MAARGFLFWTLGPNKEIVTEVVGGKVIDHLRSLRELGCLPLMETAKMIGELLNRRALTGAVVRVHWLGDQIVLQVRETPITPDEFLALVKDPSSSTQVFQDSPEIAVSV